MNEEDKQDFAEQASDDVFSQMDADGDGVVTREEFEAAQKDTPTLTGEVGFFELEGDKSLTPEDKPKEKMNKNLQFFLGVVVYPILVLIVSSLFGSIGWAFDESGQVSGFIQMMTMGGGYVGGVVVGFTSGHHSFAWGLLASIIILPLLLFALLFGFCMIIIMSDGGTI
jgi:nitrate reductase NapE component